MIDIIQYNAKHFKELCRLYNISHSSTDINCRSSFHMEDYISNIDRFKVKFLIISNRFRGYIIFNSFHSTMNRDRFNIQEIYVEKKYNTYMNYYNLIESANKGFFLKRYKYAQMYLNNSKKSLELISKLSLTSEKKMVEMKMSINGVRRIDKSDNINFTLFKSGIDEEKRVLVQNSIFQETDGHADCSLHDILYEEKQDYFIEDGCIFLNYNNKIAGYSQIILEKSQCTKPYIVNFGIIKEFRGLGLSALLLNYTLNTVKQKGFSEVYLTVNASNKIACNLYKRSGFKNTYIQNYYLYKYK